MKHIYTVPTKDAAKTALDDANIYTLFNPGETTGTNSPYFLSFL